jgi:hypothetical protein
VIARHNVKDSIGDDPEVNSEGLGTYGAESLPIEFVELSRAVRLWVLNIFLTFRAGMAEWFSRWEGWEIRWPGMAAVEPDEIRSIVITANAKNR